jgi:TRAP-type C4-dicarboxylate transport system substrate-binding protein
MAAANRQWLVVAAALAAAFASPGCDTGDASKAGGSEPPLTLRLVTAEQPNQPAAAAIKEFVRQVEEASDRSIRVRVEWLAGVHALDQRAALKVSGGEADLGFVSARAWDTEGVTTLRALHAPFLVDDDELMQEATRGGLAEEMLRGLEAANVVGLALMPEGLRHPVGFRKPLLNLGDYRGATIRVKRSRTSFALFRSLGATPKDLPTDEFNRGVLSGSVRGAETSFALVGTLVADGIYTGNVTLYPKVNTLVANAEVYAELSGEQRELLERAASRTADRVRGDAVDDRQAAERLCSAGGTIVHADPADVRALERAAEPVYDALAKDPETAAMLEQLRELGQRAGRSSEPTPAPCSGPGVHRRTPTAGTRQSIPNGVYRHSISSEELLDAGLPPHEEGYDGVHTITLRDGSVGDRQRTPAGEILGCGGSYTSTGQTISVRWTDGNCSGGFFATWSLRDGELRFTDITGMSAAETAVVRVTFGAKPFRKIE